MQGRRRTALAAALLLGLLPLAMGAFSPIRTATETASSRAGGGSPEYRLPVSVVPSEYDITLTLDKLDETSKAFTGEVTIYATAIREADSIVLHLDPEHLTVDKVGEDCAVKIIPSSTDITPPAKFTCATDARLQTLTLAWDGYYFTERNNGKKSTLTAGTAYRITIKYNGQLRDDMYGFYRSSYKTTEGNTVYLAATQFEPAYARSAFPCLDEPQYKAKFSLSITHPKGTTALSNRPTQTSGPSASGETQITVFKPTPVMSTYLVAFVVSTFQSQDGEFPPTSTSSPAPAQIPYKVWVREGEQNKQQAVYASKVGPLSLKKLEEFTQIQYSEMGLEKLDLIAIPDFAAGAMENWGLITFRETGLMYEDGETTEASKESIALVIAHEQTHMWFGDLVSPKWWDYVWLNEGFARYLQYVSMDQVKPEWRLMDTFVVRTLQGALAFDALDSSHPMSATVYTPDQIQGIFDRISYDKGASILHMIRNVLGDNNFKSALNSYLKKMKFYVAEPTNLFLALNAYATSSPPFQLPEGVTVGTVLTAWTRERGYPLVTIRTLSNGTTVATQAPFSSSGSNSSSTRWWVPLTYQLQGSTDKNRVWLNPQSESTKIEKAPGNWIIANVDQTGFYRVNYDDDNWKALATFLDNKDNVNSVGVLNRAQILDDALSLARAGVLKYPTALDLTNYLQYETDPIPWTAALGHLNFLQKMLVGDTAQEPFKKKLLKLLDEVYESVGFDETEAEVSNEAASDKNHLKLTFRAVLMSQACRLGLEKCVTKAQEKFKNMKTNKVPSSLRSTVYCTGLREGNSDDWDTLWNQYLTSSSPGEKTLILGALGCTKDSTKLKTYLSHSLDNSKVRPQDASTVFSAVLSGNDENLDVALSFFKDHFSEMQKSYGGWSAIQNVVEGLASRILDESKLKELEETLNNKDLGVAQDAAKRSLETARSNIAWRAKQIASVSNWVLNGSTSGAATTLALPGLVAALMLFLAFAEHH